MMQNVKRRKEIDLREVGKFVVYGVISCQVGLVLGLIAHLIY